MNPQELEECFLMLAQQTAAVSDVVAIICAELAGRDQPTATRIANSLEAIADDPNIETTPAFAQMAPWFAGHLRGNMDQQFLSLHKRSASESGLDALQVLMKKMGK